MVCVRWSWGPQAQRVAGSRGYVERHCYRVGLSPQYQFLRSLSWRPQPVCLRAISEEILAQSSEPEFDCNGHQVGLRHMSRDPMLASNYEMSWENAHELAMYGGRCPVPSLPHHSADNHGMRNLHTNHSLIEIFMTMGGSNHAICSPVVVRP